MSVMVAAYVVAAFLIFGACAMAQGSAPRQRKPLIGRTASISVRLKDPGDNFPQDDSREDMRRYRGH